jgi:peptidoglycan/xylan/chitin deacetylase (PgdA/CDA1 family)
VALMYHRLGDGALPGRESGEESYAVAPHAFEEHLDAIASGPARIVGFDALDGSCDLPVLLTFDDGNATDHEVAFPALRRRGLTAVFFVTPAWVGTPGYMTWEQVRELDREGMTVGVHGLDHTPLSSLGEAALRGHLAEARRAFEPHLGRRPDVLSLPGGYGSAAVVSSARAEGFLAVFGSDPLPITSLGGPRALPRFAVRRGDGVAAVRALAEQRPAALARQRVRHATLRTLRSVVGAGLYRRVRDLRMRWSSAS